MGQIECWKCCGEGVTHSCFTEYCCIDPEWGCDECERPCDICEGKGGFPTPGKEHGDEKAD